MNGSLTMGSTVKQKPWGALAASLIFLFLITAPYLAAAGAAGEERLFGGFLFNPLDGNTYLAKMYEGWRGEWRFTLPYSPDKGEGAYLYLHYLALGRLARLIGLNLILTYHMARLLAAVFMLWALRRLFRAIFAHAPGADIAFAVSIFGSGLGWTALAFGGFTSDFWVAEAYPFLSAYANFHFPLGLGLLATLLTPVNGRVAWWMAVLAALLLSIVAPFGAPLAAAVCAAVAVWESLLDRRSGAWQIDLLLRQPSFQRMAAIILGGGPMLLYSLAAIRADPLLAGWSQQNVTAAPPWWDLIISLSPLIWLLPWGIALARRSGDPGARVLLAWGVATLCMVYFPWTLQRRFLMGAIIPWAGLAGMWLGRQGRRKALMAALVFLLALPTNLIVLLAGVQGAQTGEAALYISRAEAEVYAWIEVNTPADARILAGPESGMFLPAHTGRRVYYGHPFETVNAQESRRSVEAFFRGAPPDDYLSKFDYVLWGPRERLLGDWQPGETLVEVFSAGDVNLYARR